VLHENSLVDVEAVSGEAGKTVDFILLRSEQKNAAPKLGHTDVDGLEDGFQFIQRQFLAEPKGQFLHPINGDEAITTAQGATNMPP